MFVGNLGIFLFFTTGVWSLFLSKFHYTGDDLIIYRKPPKDPWNPIPWNNNFSIRRNEKSLGDDSSQVSSEPDVSFSHEQKVKNKRRTAERVSYFNESWGKFDSPFNSQRESAIGAVLIPPKGGWISAHSHISHNCRLIHCFYQFQSPLLLESTDKGRIPSEKSWTPFIVPMGIIEGDRGGFSFWSSANEDKWAVECSPYPFSSLWG